MTTYELDSAETRFRMWGRRMKKKALTAALIAGHEFRKGTPLVRSHIIDHGYSLCAMGCADAAGFVHSVFAGLIVSAAAFVLFEWKVSAE